MSGFLIFPSKITQWASLIVSMLAAIAATFLLYAAACAFQQSSVMFRIFNDWHLHDSLIYSTYASLSLSNEEKKSELHAIQSTPGVLDANVVSVIAINLPDIQTDFSIPFVQYSDSLLQDIQYSLAEGQYPSPDQRNTIILPYAYRDACEVGDVLSGNVYVFGALSGSPEIPVSVTVAGFLEDQAILEPERGGGYLSDMFVDHPGGFSNQFDDTYGVIYDLYDNNGNRVESTITNLFLIRSDGSVPVDSLKESLETVVLSPTYLETGDEMIREYIRMNTEEIGETLALLLTALVLSFSILTASTLLELVYRQKEMATLYLVGASWNQCLGIILARQILPIVSGFLLGTLLFSLSGNSGLFYVMKPSMTLADIVLVLVIQIAFVSAAILPFRFSTKFKTPHELFRKD